jgi:hypothetical protein
VDKQEGDVHLYRPENPADYGVVPIGRIVGQACLVPNYAFPTIPSNAPRSACPGGKRDSKWGKGNGDQLFFVNKLAMRRGRSFQMKHV